MSDEPENAILVSFVNRSMSAVKYFVTQNVRDVKEILLTRKPLVPSGAEGEEAARQVVRRCLDVIKNDYRALLSDAALAMLIAKAKDLHGIVDAGDEIVIAAVAVKEVLSLYRGAAMEICSKEEVDADPTCAWLDKKFYDQSASAQENVSGPLLASGGGADAAQVWKDPATWEGVTKKLTSIQKNMDTVFLHLYRLAANEISMYKRKAVVVDGGQKSAVEVIVTNKHRTSGSTRSADSDGPGSKGGAKSGGDGAKKPPTGTPPASSGGAKSGGDGAKKPPTGALKPLPGVVKPPKDDQGDEEPINDRGGAGATGPPPAPPPPGGMPPPPPPPGGRLVPMPPGAPMPPPPFKPTELTFSCMIPVVWESSWDKGDSAAKENLVRKIREYVFTAMGNLYYEAETDGSDNRWRLMSEYKEPRSCIKPDLSVKTYIIETFSAWRMARWLHYCGIKKKIIMPGDCPWMPLRYEDTQMYRYLKTNWLEDRDLEEERRDAEAASAGGARSRFGAPKMKKGMQAAMLAKRQLALDILPDYDAALLLLKKVVDYYITEAGVAGTLTVGDVEFTVIPSDLFFTKDKRGIFDAVRASLRVITADVVDAAFCMRQNEVLWKLFDDSYPNTLDPLCLHPELRGSDDVSKELRKVFEENAALALGGADVKLFKYKWSSISSNSFLSSLRSSAYRAFIPANALDSIWFAFQQYLFENNIVLMEPTKASQTPSGAAALAAADSEENNRFGQSTDYLNDLQINDKALNTILGTLRVGYMRDYGGMDALASLEMYMLSFIVGETLAKSKRLESACVQLVESGVGPYLDNVSEFQSKDTNKAAQEALGTIRKNWSYIKNKVTKRNQFLMNTAASARMNAKILYSRLAALCKPDGADGMEKARGKEKLADVARMLKDGDKALTRRFCMETQMQLDAETKRDLWVILSYARRRASIMFQRKLNKLMVEPEAKWGKNIIKLFIGARIRAPFSMLYKVCAEQPGNPSAGRGVGTEGSLCGVEYIQSPPVPLDEDPQGMVDAEDVLHKLCGFYRLFYRLILTKEIFPMQDYMDGAERWNIQRATEVNNDVLEDVCTNVARELIVRSRLLIGSQDPQLCEIFEDGELGINLREKVVESWKKVHARHRPSTPEQEGDGAAGAAASSSSSVAKTRAQQFDEYYNTEFQRLVDSRVTSKANTPRTTPDQTPYHSDNDDNPKERRGSIPKKVEGKSASSALSCILEEKNDLI